ncbi:MAG: hypothetical protein IAE87_05510 [Rhodobacteraceae bacterium]|jgi:hypothetical protein|nr:hypothetical protein [Paracoccaceae bacterium]
MAGDATLRSRLRALGLALLNATLLLAVALVFGSVLLIARVQSLAADVTAAVQAGIGPAARAALAAELPELTAAAARLQGVQDRIDAALLRVGTADSAAAAELAGLRRDVQMLAGQVADLSLRLQQMGTEGYQAVIAAMRQVLGEVAARLDARLPVN